MTTPTRTEFEAAAYRWLREQFSVHLIGDKSDFILSNDMLPNEADTAIAAAMGWPTAPLAAPPEDATIARLIHERDTYKAADLAMQDQCSELMTELREKDQAVRADERERCAGIAAKYANGCTDCEAFDIEQEIRYRSAAAQPMTEAQSRNEVYKPAQPEPPTLTDAQCDAIQEAVWTFEMSGDRVGSEEMHAIIRTAAGSVS